MKPIHSIPLKPLRSDLTIHGADPAEITLQSPAQSVFLDFDSRQPMLLAQDVSVDDAAYLMRITYAKFKLVVDRNNHFCGIISVRDVDSVKVLAAASSMGVARSDLNVKDIMTSAAHLKGVQQRILPRLSVADLIDVMEFEGQRYLMVLDASDNLSGMICADEIAHRLGRTIDIAPVAKGFNEVFSALRV